MTTLLSAFVVTTLLGNVVQVGATRTYATVQAGYAAANDGDTIEIDAGNYPSTSFKVGKSNLTFKGVGGRPHISYSGDVPNGKGIFVVEDPAIHDIVFDNLEISGGKGTSGNEAAIRYQGKNLTVRNCYLHDSYNGILEGHNEVSGSVVLVENTELAYNGNSGYEHNMYISASVAQLTVRYSYSHHVLEGHLIKTRALSNYIYANRITDEDWTGTNQASAVIDIPQGGRTYIVGNMLHKGTHPGNSVGAIWYARENGDNAAFELYVVNNTFVSDTGVSNTAFVLAQRATTVLVANNIVLGQSAEMVHFEDATTRTVTVTNNLLDTQVATVTSSPGATISNPAKVSDAKLVDRAAFDWHLVVGSPAIDAGVDPGSAAAYDLTATAQYVHPVAAETRAVVDVRDIGAFEYGNVGTVIPGGLPPTDPTGPTVPAPVGPIDPPPTTPLPTSPGNQDPPQAGDGGAEDTSIRQSCNASGAPSWFVLLVGVLALRYRRR